MFSITLSGSLSAINVRESNLSIGEQQFNIITIKDEDIYKVVYNSSVSK